MSRYAFTLNNYTNDDCTIINSIPHLYLVYGYEESPTTGTPHLQGFITLPSLRRLTALKKLHPKIHWEKAIKDSMTNATYCKKSGNFYEDGKVPTQGKRTDLEKAATLLLEGASVAAVALDNPSVFIKYSRGLREFALICQQPYDHPDVRGYWYYGAPGTGKSRFARTHDSFYLKDQNKWFDGYAGETTIILDDLDTNVLGHHLKIWSDRYACNGETKGGTVCLRHHRFIVTSNYSIESLFGENQEMASALNRRFVVRNFNLFPYRPQPIKEPEPSESSDINE